MIWDEKGKKKKERKLGRNGTRKEGFEEWKAGGRTRGRNKAQN